MSAPLHAISNTSVPAVEGDGKSDGLGVHGISSKNDGVLGEGVNGVYGRDLSGVGNGVIGFSAGGRGVWGHSTSAIGVLGESVGGHGAQGVSTNDVGVWGESTNHEGVHAVTHSTTTAGLAAYQANADSDQPALYANHAGNRTAAIFVGSVVVSGDLLLSGADYAESFESASTEPIMPGSVVVLDDDGRITACEHPYDVRVAGVVSGAGTFRPGVILDSGRDPATSVQLALMGKVFCRVDGTTDQIRAGDLLTSSGSPGRAMKVTDRSRALGAVVGKALAPCDGLAEIPILIALQ
jgi:hypothetical protein